MLQHSPLLVAGIPMALNCFPWGSIKLPPAKCYWPGKPCFDTPTLFLCHLWSYLSHQGCWLLISTPLLTCVPFWHHNLLGYSPDSLPLQPRILFLCPFYSLSPTSGQPSCVLNWSLTFPEITSAPEIQVFLSAWDPLPGYSLLQGILWLFPRQPFISISLSL